MKLNVIMSMILISLATNLQAQFYGAADMGAAYRTKPLDNKGTPVTEKQTTAVLSINTGYRLHFENQNGALDILAELNNRLPVLDNTNALSSGIRAGVMLPAGNAWLVPMGGVSVNYRSIEGTTVKPNVALKAVFTTAFADANWYLEASYINNMAGIGIGLFIRDKKLF